MSDEPDLKPMVKKLAGWQPLDKGDEQALLALPHGLKGTTPSHHLVREGEASMQCCLMLSGFSVRYKVVGTGARQIVSIHMRGDLVDLQNSILGFADHGVQMLTSGLVALIPREAVKQIALDRPRVGMAMWQDTLVDASIFREWIANVGRRNAHARIAHLLCEFCASAILSDDPHILTDASIDPRSLANPLVAGDFGLRFYAGVPLKTSDGHNLGTLCIIDKEPRPIDDSQIAGSQGSGLYRYGPDRDATGGPARRLGG
jgi:CRP-like cAMP-binding protein